MKNKNNKLSAVRAVLTRTICGNPQVHTLATVAKNEAAFNSGKTAIDLQKIEIMQALLQSIAVSSRANVSFLQGVSIVLAMARS